MGLAAQDLIAKHLQDPRATVMPITCIDGEITEAELALWEVALPPTRVALLCDEVRAVFVGPPLARGLAVLKLNRQQFERLFPTKARRKNPWSLRKWAAKIRDDDARRVLMSASWHQLRAAAAFEDGDAQIRAAIAWQMGLRG